MADKNDDPVPGVPLAGWWLMERALREDVMGPIYSADPCWYILLDLYRTRAAGGKVQITSLPSMIGATHSTAGRWTRYLIGAGMLRRVRDPGDQRRSFVELSATGGELVQRYFTQLAEKGDPPAIWKL